MGVHTENHGRLEKVRYELKNNGMSQSTKGMSNYRLGERRFKGKVRPGFAS